MPFSENSVNSNLKQSSFKFKATNEIKSRSDWSKRFSKKSFSTTYLKLSLYENYPTAYIIFNARKQYNRRMIIVNSRILPN